MPRMAEIMIPTDAGDIWADDSGGDLPPLFMLHPGIGDSRIWNPIMPALLTTYRVIRFDARSFGKSPVPSGDFSLLGDAVKVMDHFGVQRAAVVGSSIGGSTALSLALDEPARVSALVLLCPGASGYPWPDESHEDDEFAEAAEQGGVNAVAAWAAKTWAAAGSTPEVDEQLRSAATAWMSGSHRFERETTPVYDRLGDISVPTSLLVGDLDKPSLIEADLQIAKRIPDCQLIRVEGVDHLPTIRVPDLVVKTIDETIARTV